MIKFSELIHSKAEKARKKLKYFFKTAILSIIIFAILFIIANIQAFSEIGKSKIKTILGTKDEQVFTKEKVKVKDEPLPLDVVKDSGKLKTDYPEMDSLEVIPPDNRIIIPRINKNVPLVKTDSKNYFTQDWDSLDQEILSDLKRGVVIYPSSAMPGKKGNTVVTGHSSYYAWDDGKYKDVFARLHEIILGDEIYIYYQQKKYFYEVEDIKVVNPEDIQVMHPKAGENILTVITCTPVGTNLRRLVITAKLVN